MESKDLNLARKALMNSLGDNSKKYFEKMKYWFQMKHTKEDFDREARNIMTEEQIALHNEFLLCLFNKVRGLAFTPTIRTVNQKSTYNHTHLVKEKALDLKRKYITDKSNFEPADIYADVLNEVNSPTGDEPIGANRSSAQELLLPDHTFVFARLLLAAWENNMDGAEDSTARIIIAATQVFLKNILTVMFSRRNGFSVYKDSLIHNMGEPVYDMWKINSGHIPKYSTMNHPTEISVNYGQIPVAKPSIVDAEHAKAFSLACAPQTLQPTPPPINLLDLEKTLKIHKNLIKNHTVFATNVERLFTYNTHMTSES